MLRALASGFLARKVMNGLSRRRTTTPAAGATAGTATTTGRAGGMLSHPMVRMAGMAGMSYMASRMMRGGGRRRRRGLGFGF